MPSLPWAIPLGNTTSDGSNKMAWPFGRSNEPTREEKQLDLPAVREEFQHLPPMPLEEGQGWIRRYRNEYSSVYGKRPPLSHMLSMRKQALLADEAHVENKYRRWSALIQVAMPVGSLGIGIGAAGLVLLNQLGSG